MSKSQIVFDVAQHTRTQIDYWKKDAANWGQRVLRIVSLVAIAVALAGSPIGAANAKSTTPQNVNVSQRPGNESEEAIAVNPTNPKNIVIFTNIAEGVNGMFLAVTFDGGRIWNRRIVGEGNDVLGDTCCDPSLSFDEYGNLFMTYLFNVENTVPVALSTDDFAVPGGP